MSSWSYDTFGGVGNLTSHTPDVPGSGTWTLNLNWGASGVTPTIGSNKASILTLAIANVLNLLSCPGTAVSAEYDVAADIVIPSLLANFGIAGRIQADGHAYAVGWIGIQWRLYKLLPGGTSTQIAVANDGSVVINTPYRVKLQIRNTGTANQTALTLLVSTDGGATFTTKISTTNDTDANYTPAGQGGVFNFIQGNNINASWTNFQAIDKNATDLQGGMATPYVSRTGVSIVLAGTGTTWGAGTPGTPTFTVSGTNGASITGQVVASGTSATLTVNTGASPGTLIITDPSTGNSKTFQITLPPITLAVNDANWVWSPYNWEFSGSSWARSQMQGAYSLIVVSGTQTATLLVDVASEVAASLSASLYPYLAWSIDNSPINVFQLAAATTSVSLSASLDNSVNHVVEMWLRQSDTDVAPRWNPPANYLKTTGLLVGATGTSVSPAGYVRAKRAIGWGDSITAAASTELTPQGDGVDAYLQTVGLVVGAEVGIIGFSGQSWAVASGTDTPPFYTIGDDVNSTWNKQAAGVSRLVAGKLSPVPDYVFNNMGFNFGAVQATVQSWLTACRAAVNPSTPIFIIGVYGNNSTVNATNATLLAAVTAQADPYCYCIILSDREINGMGKFILGPTQQTNDSTHPRTQYHARVGAMIAAKVQAILTPAGGYSRNPLY